MFSHCPGYDPVFTCFLFAWCFGQLVQEYVIWLCSPWAKMCYNLFSCLPEYNQNVLGMSASWEPTTCPVPVFPMGTFCAWQLELTLYQEQYFSYWMEASWIGTLSSLSFCWYWWWWNRYCLGSPSNIFIIFT